MDAEKRVHDIERAFRRGMLSERERYKSVIETWEQATKDVTNEVMRVAGQSSTPST